MPETLSVQICQACGSPSTSGFTHDLGQGHVHELCGDCGAASDAISYLRGVSHDPAARRARVARILELLDQADEVCGDESDLGRLEGGRVPIPPRFWRHRAQPVSP